MDNKFIKQMKRRLGYEKHIVTQIHEEIFKTTSEHKYYELGVATGVYTIHNMIQKFIEQGYEEIVLKDMLEFVEKSIIGNHKDNENMADMFNRMIDYDKEEE